LPNLPFDDCRSRRRLTRYLLVAFALCVFSTAAFSQTPADSGLVEAGKYRLHKFEQAIGEESYEVRRDGDSLITTSEFEFTDRGSRVPLHATLKTSRDLAPQSLEMKGSTSRLSTIDLLVSINGHDATVRSGSNTTQVEVPENSFTISGYSPVAFQMMLVRRWKNLGGKGAIPTLPAGKATIEYRGSDSVPGPSGAVSLDRYSIHGIIWGTETLWLDRDSKLVALVTVDAETDHFEAVREDFEPQLSLFVARAASDGMAGLAALTKQAAPATKPGRLMALVGGTLIDLTGAPPVPDAVVLIDQGKIVAAGPKASVKIPSGATIIDTRGKFVLPGLWDMHAHFEQVEWGPVYLAAGVTTVRDVGNEFDFITSVRDAIKSGKGIGPRILAAGIIDGEGPTALGIIRAANEEQARAAVDRYKQAGFQQIKIYSSVKLDVVKAITAEAHRQGMTVTGHVPNGMNAFQAVEAGMDQINHVQYIAAVMRPQGPGAGPGGAGPDSSASGGPESQAQYEQKTINFFKEHGTVVDPTLALFELIMHPQATPVSSFEPGVLKVAPELSDQLTSIGTPAAGAARSTAIFNRFLAIVGMLHRAGVPIVAGTDQAVPGHSLHREIELYVKAGFTPMEALQSATIVPARIMKVDNMLGTIEPGKIADIIIVDGDPLESISNIRKVKFVMKDGVLLECAPLWQSVGFKP
jgi:imidazolonepropionase-like amidohydrolase